MNPSAQELLAQMKKERANISKEPLPEEYYLSKIVVNRNKRASLIVAMVFFFFLFSSIIFADLMVGNNWLLIAGPILFCGAIISLIPPTEEWSYKPWQIYPQKYERHFSD
jgi:hypothetical protein